MITILIGHRGVGKTNLLRRLEQVFLNRTDIILKDLDTEVEVMHRRSIDSIFRQMGEAEFRTLESLTFEHLYHGYMTGTELIIAVGAGFDFPIPKDVQVVWVRRPTDANGRVFLDRPQLGTAKSNGAVAPLADWESRFPKRDERYRSLAHQELILPEGSLHDSVLEEHFFMTALRSLPYSLTVLPENFRSDEFFDRRRLWNLKWLELRDDLLTESQITRLQQNWPVEKLMYSVRKGPLTARPKAGAVDWPVELGAPPFPIEILSLHERSGSLPESVARFPSHNAAILKLAIPIESFAELLEGHRWWKKDPQKRAFFPMSKNGRWQWYRQLFGPQMPIHFFREGDGTSLDQPVLWQTLTTLKWDQSFAAVLGSPIRHSWSPSLQREFFDQQLVPVVAIEILEKEWASALPVLQELGLRFAAVTSPHKQNAFLLAGANISDEAKALGSVNTLALSESGWNGHNTDFKGATGLFYGEFTDDRPIVVWGGGGTKETLKAALPNAEFVSAREGKKLTTPIHLVWATGRGREFVWPQPAVFVQDVVDLNYTEDSPGREIALRAGCPYKSGETMFIQQGLAQREFWKRF